METNPAIPSKSILFEPVEDSYGSRLALVFGNEYMKGECPFHQKQCYHCDIGAGEGTQFTPEMNKERLIYFKEHYRNVLPDISHLVIYNSGSTLNKKEMSRETSGEILDYASSLDKCKIVSFDSREMYVTEETLDYVVAKLRGDQQTRIILGVESQNDEVRIEKLNKRMTKKRIERAFEVAGRSGGRVGIDVNVVFQPPELIGEEAVEEAVATLKYGLDLGKQYGVPIDFNFHPYYPSKKSKAMYPDHPRANLEDGKKALVRMKKEIDIRGSNAKIFIGWQDEEHDQEQGLMEGELREAVRKFDLFNVTQNVCVL